MARQVPRHLRCVGIGVGPANLSLASLPYSHRGSTSLLLDCRDRFGWHDGRQLAGASSQVSLFKGLVSHADPTNPFSFLSHLLSRGGIYHFVDAQFDFVPRQEFRNDLEWASRCKDNVVPGEEVPAVEFDEHVVVHADKRVVTADNVAAREQRGLADPNLRLVAWRSQRIVDQIRGVHSGEQLPSFMERAAAPGQEGWRP